MLPFLLQKISHKQVLPSNTLSSRGLTAGPNPATPPIWIPRINRGMTNMTTIISYSHITTSPVGKIGIALQDDVIVKVDMLADDTPTHCANKALEQQLQNYFQDPTQTFTFKTQPQGTAFQQRVWQALTTIPVGTALTYGQLAKQLQSGPCAVGQACRRNPIPIIIPCHRVVGATNIGGYAGETQGKIADIKKWLLQHEKYRAS
jgi:methylated-DNA-[protein]-cysteine S-methyltransferase